MSRRAEWIGFTVILVAYLIIAGLYATRTPDWQAPDEPAHYNYVRQIADEGRLPVLEMGDWQQQYQETLVAGGFDPALTARLDTLEYEDHQPPLYYLLQAPVYALTRGDLTAMRLLSVLLGAGVVALAWAALRVLAPGWPGIALAGAAFVAFLPQHIAILSSVSNDVLAELIVAAALLAVLIYTGNGETRRDVHPALLGLLVGLALLTKTTIYFVAGIAALAVLLRARREGWSWRRLIREGAPVLIPALVLGGLWWGRNLSVYGGTDFTGLARHDAVTVGQLRTSDYIERVLGGSEQAYLENYLRTTFHSFWGQFGWMQLPMPPRIYTLLLIGTLAVLAGAGLFFWRHPWARQITPPQRDALIMFAAVTGFTVAAYVLYNRDFVQFQGRYLYPALIPLAFLVAAGLHGWTGLIAPRSPAPIWLPVAAMGGLALLAFYALERVIVPNLPVW